MWTSHLGPTLQLLTQACLETSPATVTASVTLPQTPRWPWKICSLSISLARCCKGFPPTLSAHHESFHTDRFSASPSRDRKLYTYTKQKWQKDFTTLRSSKEHPCLHHNHASCDHIAYLISQPRINMKVPPTLQKSHRPRRSAYTVKIRELSMNLSKALEPSPTSPTSIFSNPYLFIHHTTVQNPQNLRPPKLSHPCASLPAISSTYTINPRTSLPSQQHNHPSTSLPISTYPHHPPLYSYPHYTPNNPTTIHPPTPSQKTKLIQNYPPPTYKKPQAPNNPNASPCSSKKHRIHNTLPELPTQILSLS